MKKLLVKLVSVLLSVCVMLSLGSVSASSFVNGLEDAILAAKSKLSIPDFLTEFDSGIASTREVSEYELRWYTEDNEESISVTINSFGDIINYSHQSRADYNSGPRFAIYDADALSTLALEWLQKINPGWETELVFNPSVFSPQSNIYSENTSISFTRVVNGIPFLNDNVYFNMNNRTGEVIHMTATHTYADAIPSVNLAFGTEKASEEFFRKSPLKLIYSTAADDKAELIYTPESPYIKINAQTGELVNSSKIYASKEEYSSLEAPASAAMDTNRGENKLSESELNNLDEIKALIPRDELEARARALANTGLDNASLKSFSYGRAYTGKENTLCYNAELRFVFNSGNADEYNAYVTFDAQTGELIRYSAYNYKNQYTKSDISNADTESALKAAKDFLTRYASEQSMGVNQDTTGAPDYDGNLSFNFVRHENGIPFPENYVNITVDSEFGRICNFYKSWSPDTEFSSPDGTMSIKEAEQKFAENLGFELSYMQSYTEGSDNPDIVLAYTLNTDRGSSINAKTGEPNGYLDTSLILYPNDISNHYAKEQITALTDAGIIKVSPELPEFRPDETITHRELAAMVARLSYRYDVWEIPALVDFMRSNNLLKNDERFEPEKPAIRTDGVMYIIRALGYREIAELDGIYTCSFADKDSIPNEHLGYVTLAKALKLVKGDENGCFNPNAMLSRADTAIMIYNYLAR